MKKTEPSCTWEMIKQKEWLVSHGLIIIGLILLSIGLGIVLPLKAGILVIVGIWLLCGGICGAVVSTSKKPAEKKPIEKPAEKPAAKPAAKKK